MDALTRKILHVDMDAFYASIEQRDQPSLRGRPVIVGGTPERRGVVAAASYEARAFGVRSAMPAGTAVRLCPEAVLVRPRFEVYREVSAQIRAIFHRYTDLVEPLSLDEAYLDVTTNKLDIPSATWCAAQIRREIRAETGLTASAGIAPNKFLAKIASDLNKPDGQAVIPPDRVDDFLRDLPVGKIFGVGPVTEEKLLAMGIRTAGDLRALGELALAERFGKAGAHYYRIARGIDDRPVQPHRRRKSVGAEETFATDRSDRDELDAFLVELAERVAGRLARAGTRGRTITVKARYADFTTVTRSRTLAAPTADATVLLATGRSLLDQTEAGHRPLRLLGLTVAKLDNETDGSDGGTDGGGAALADHTGAGRQLVLPITC